MTNSVWAVYDYDGKRIGTVVAVTFKAALCESQRVYGTKAADVDYMYEALDEGGEA